MAARKLSSRFIIDSLPNSSNTHRHNTLSTYKEHENEAIKAGNFRWRINPVPRAHVTLVFPFRRTKVTWALGTKLLAHKSNHMRISNNFLLNGYVVATVTV